MFFSFFFPFLGISFCSVGGPRIDGEICPHKNLIFGENEMLAPSNDANTNRKLDLSLLPSSQKIGLSRHRF